LMVNGLSGTLIMTIYDVIFILNEAQ
jgi:hypothetical protein